MLKDVPHVAVYLDLEVQFCDGDEAAHPMTHTGVGIELRVAVVPPEGGDRPYWPPTDEATVRAVLQHVAEVVGIRAAAFLRGLEGADEPQMKIDLDPKEAPGAPLIH